MSCERLLRPTPWAYTARFIRYLLTSPYLGTILCTVLVIVAGSKRKLAPAAHDFCGNHMIKRFTERPAYEVFYWCAH